MKPLLRSNFIVFTDALGGPRGRWLPGRESCARGSDGVQSLTSGSFETNNN
jgi:hypothetical protein